MRGSCSGTSALVAVGSVVALLAGCSEPTTTVLQVEPLPSHAEIFLVDAEGAPLVLSLTNQSFDHDPALVEVVIDGVPIIDSRLFVGGQHNYVGTGVELPPGEHVLEASSDSGGELRRSFTLPADGSRRFADIAHWGGGRGDGDLEWTFRDEPIPIM